MAARLNILRMETAGTEEEAAEGLADALGMEIEEDRGSEGGKGVMGLKGHSEPLSSSPRMQIQAEPRLLMPVMGSTI